MVKSVNVRKQFEDYILKTKIPGSLPLEDQLKIYFELLDFAEKITPTELFRFRKCSKNNFEALKKDQIYLSLPKTFNDPHDSLLYFNEKKLANTFDKLNNKDAYEHVKKLLEDKSYKESQIQLLGEEFVNHTIQYFSKDEKPLKYPKNYMEIVRKFYEPRMKYLNDLAKKSLLQAAFVSCFSEKVDSTLMWSHYSDNQAGFAICYDFKSIYKKLLYVNDNRSIPFFLKFKLFPVIYSNERLDATEYLEHNMMFDIYRVLGIEFPMPFFDKLFYYKAFLIKSKEWSYEKEWRIITLMDLDIEKEKKDYWCINGIKPKSVFLGCKISDWNKKRLINLSREKGIPVYQMKIDDSKKKFRLNYHTIID